MLEYWKKNKIFEKSVEGRPDNKKYTFYDGPPFITGLPHYGHLLGSIVKDVIPRFQTMKGYRVPRVWGWDCHGLPAENKVEKELGINSKREIETLGIGKFVDACKRYVDNVSEEWEWYVDHVGRWVDFQHAYRTMDRKYMESVLWVFQQLYEKELIYKGKRVSLFCPRCSTPISNFEVAMDNSYKVVTDPSVIIKFKLKPTGEYLLAWTTTPWTLPFNEALAVNEDLDYLIAEIEDEKFIFAKKLQFKIFGDQKINIIGIAKGTELVGKEYESLYSYFPTKPGDHKVYPAEFVSTDDGTGVVHISPGFGEDDTNLGMKHGLSMIDGVNDEGHLNEKVEVAGGKYFKAADKLIIEDLKIRGLLFRQVTLSHSYPHCHRCGTALLYKAQVAWYINIQNLKNQLLKTNQGINWVPEHFKHGRFELGIKNAPDWCISRTRYWGAPIPVWECPDCDWRFVAGSITEIEESSGQKVIDLHRPQIDDIIIPCKQCGKSAMRVKEVLDSWVEAASMPYAQSHYPFENEAAFKQNFPADFITEYTGQLRAWFYVMHVISNALYQKRSFNNVVVTGVIMGNDGRKMSKNYGNYPDPKDSIIKYGADALRLYLMGSPIVAGEDISIAETEWQIELRTTLNTLWNSYRFFSENAATANYDYSDKNPKSNNVLDQWVLSRLAETEKKVDEYLTAYYLPKAVKELKVFVDDLSNWYIRESRDRVRPSSQDEKDKLASLQTMAYVLMNFLKIASPIIPFITEYLYRQLTNSASVHLQDWPTIDHKPDANILKQMTLARKIVELGHAQRKLTNHPVKQPYRKVSVKSQAKINLDSEVVNLIKHELNVDELVFESDGKFELAIQTIFDFQLDEDLIDRGKARDIIRKLQQEGKTNNCQLNELVIGQIPDWPKSFENEIKQKAMLKELRRGQELKIIRA